MNHGRLPLAAWLALAYLPVLTLALLLENPFQLAGGREGDLRAVYQYVKPVAHLLAFVPLGFLLAAGRWPVSRLVLLGCLVLYALTTETLQALIPRRTFDLADLAQNIAGLAVGAALGWTLRRVWQQGQPATE